MEQDSVPRASKKKHERRAPPLEAQIVTTLSLTVATIRSRSETHVGIESWQKNAIIQQCQKQILLVVKDGLQSKTDFGHFPSTRVL